MDNRRAALRAALTEAMGDLLGLPLVADDAAVRPNSFVVDIGRVRRRAADASQYEEEETTGDVVTGTCEGFVTVYRSVARDAPAGSLRALLDESGDAIDEAARRFPGAVYESDTYTLEVQAMSPIDEYPEVSAADSSTGGLQSVISITFRQFWN